MKFSCVGWWVCLLAISAPPVAAQRVAVFPQDYAMEMYFRFYLADGGPDEIRCVWFPQNDLQIGWKMTVNLRTGSVEILRDVYDPVRVAEHPNPGVLKADKIAAVREILAQLPPAQAMFPLAQCVLVAHDDGARMQVAQYNRVNPPALIQQLYELCGGNFSFGEADVRDALGLTADETEKYAARARPWSVPRVLDWYRQANNAADRKFWAHVLSVSGDPRAALELEKNLGQGDNSADLREMASYFFGQSAIQNRVTLAEAQAWFQTNRPRLEAQAAILSGQSPPAPPTLAPNCPEVVYHEIPVPHGGYDEATVTIDRTGQAHITLKRAVPLQRDFQLSVELIQQLRKLLSDNDFFTATEPKAPASPTMDAIELTVTADGQKRTIRQTWAPNFAPVSAYLAQLVFLTSASATP